MPVTDAAPPVFVLRLQPMKGVDSIRSLRFLLKALLRRAGMKAISIEEERPCP
jgi:hypothetical protein